MKDLIIIMPVYNEESIIKSVLYSWLTKLDSMHLNYEIHVYNDGSKDRTAEIIANCSAEYPEKIIVHNKQNSGHGPTILQGYLENADQTKWLFQIDSDNEMKPDFFDLLWNQRMNYDFLAGKRDGRRQHFSRKIISFISRLCVRLFYGKSIWDVNTPYRLMRTETFKEIFKMLPRNTFAPNVIISGMAAKEKFRCFEIPIPQQNRQTGEVSIKKWKLFKAAIRSFMQTISFAFTSQMRWTWWAALFISLISGLAAICNWRHDFDSSVFVHVGQVMHEGGVPYLDIIDHKGPLIYWINYLSLYLGKYGILLPQYMMWLIIFYTVWRWLRKEWSAHVSCVAFCACVIGAVFYNEKGNYTETYAFPLILFPLLFLYDTAMQKKYFSLKQCFVTGVCTGGIMMLRPNMVAMPVTVALFLLYEAGKNKKLKLLLLQILAGFSGLLAVILPFILWLYFHDALEAFWRSYILFNIEYSQNYLTFPSFSDKIIYLTAKSYFFMSAVFFFVFSVLLCIFEKNQNRKKLLFLNSIFLFISLIIFYINPHVRHYYLVMIPAVFVPVAIFTEYYFDKARITKNAFWHPLLLMLFCCRITFPLVFINFKYRFPEPNAEMRLFASYIGDESVSIRIKYSVIYRLEGGFKTKLRYILWWHKWNYVWRDEIIREELFPPDPFLILPKGGHPQKPVNGYWILVAEGDQNSLYKFVPERKTFNNKKII